MWWEAMKKEFHVMTKQQVWCKTTKSFMTHKHGCTKCKWVFKIKVNGMNQSKLTACGYLTGVDFIKNLFPVVNESTFRVLLLIMFKIWLLSYNGQCQNSLPVWRAGGRNLLGVPSWYEGCKQRQVHNFLRSVSIAQYKQENNTIRQTLKFLKQVGYTRGNAFPSLNMKTSVKVTVYISLYEKTNFIIGNSMGTNDAIKQLQENGLVLKKIGCLYHLS